MRLWWNLADAEKFSSCQGSLETYFYGCAVFSKRRGQKSDTSEAANAPRLQSKIRKVCLAIVAALIAAGVLLPFIGFAAAGFNPTVFTAEADERTSEFTLGLARQI